ncbi:MAG: peptidoglycan-binding protein [Scytonematopsis contorta HA4267-MV1]|nr:peptidoglycan-binding protein [Scytonematopsis contorta HA4267-MV1]
METSNTPIAENSAASASATASGINLPALKQGDSGEAVRFLQQVLIHLGYLNSSNFNANFGTNTKQAVINFQSSNALTADGIVGRLTWRALGAAL